MKVKELLAHHGIVENPFGQEDAQSDHVFREHCLNGTHHPAWDKILGTPGQPATSVVFGEKGSGKTALRLQIVDQIRQHNEKSPKAKVFVIQYDDFNPFLDNFRDRLRGRRRKPERALTYWRLYDHMDAILSLGVKRLVRTVLEAEKKGVHPDAELTMEDVERLSPSQRRDLLLLAAFYNNTYDQAPDRRWNELRHKLGYQSWLNTHTWTSKWDLWLGWFVTLLTVIIVTVNWSFLSIFSIWSLLVLFLGWLPFLRRQFFMMKAAWRASRQIRVFDHQPNTLRRILGKFDYRDIEGQRMPTKDRSDDRYELLSKFRTILDTLGYGGVMVLVDRVDEPHLINGAPERMRDLIWPMFDNKFLRHANIGFKLLLPAEVVHYLGREEAGFYEKSRLDKLNLIQSLEWTGESLYDVATDRIQACADPSSTKNPTVGDFFDDTITREELIGIFARFRVPRHLFKFLYRLMVDHCNRYTSENPVWTIDRDTLHSSLSIFMRDLNTFDKGLGVG